MFYIQLQTCMDLHRRYPVPPHSFPHGKSLGSLDTKTQKIKQKQKMKANVQNESLASKLNGKTTQINIMISYRKNLRCQHHMTIVPRTTKLSDCRLFTTKKTTAMTTQNVESFACKLIVLKKKCNANPTPTKQLFVVVIAVRNVVRMARVSDTCNARATIFVPLFQFTTI